ncbi:protein C7orf25 [Capsicum chacoense]
MEREEGAVVEEAKRRCTSLKHRIQTFIATPQKSSWKTTLLRLINSELSFLNRLSLSNNNVKLSTNIGYLESIVHILENPLVTSVSRVCKPISISSKLSVYIDVICSFNGKPVWFVVSDRNPKYVSWEDSGNTRNWKGLRRKIQELLFAALEASVMVRPCSVVLFFANGLESCVLEKVRDEFGATNLGFGFCDFFDCECVDELEDWVTVMGRSFEKACVLEIKVESFSSSSRIADSRREVKLRDKDGEMLTGLSGNASDDVKLGDSFCALVAALRSWSGFGGEEETELVNFDTTALVAIVSGICNGGIDRILATPESELRSRFKANYEFMIGQVNAEMKKPIHMELMPVISQKRGMVCQSVCSEFHELVSMCGGPNERSRAEHFLNRLRVVPDCPSERLTSLPTTRKLASKNKVTFGTGDYWHAPTITANMAFVRAVSQTGMSLFTIEHTPRALVGD